MKKKTGFSIIPILFLVALYPLITNLVMTDTGLEGYAWFSNEGTKSDFFLYTKSRVLAWCAGIMLLLLLDKIFIKREKVQFDRMFWLPCAYGVLTIVSTAFSANRDFSLKGGYGQYESLWVLLSYLVIAFYTYNVFELKNHNKLFRYALYFASAFLNLMGISQWVGADLMNTDFIKNLVVHGNMRQYLDRIEFNFAQVTYNRVYMTLYNPNYVGVYLVLTIPLLLSCIYLAEKRAEKLWAGLLAVVSLFCLVGCGSRSGVIALAISLAVIAVLFFITCFRNKIKFTKNFRIGIGFLFLLAVVYFLTIFLGDGFSRDSGENKFQQSCYDLENITVLGDTLQIRYKGETYYFDEEKFLTDEQGKTQPFEETANGQYSFPDEKLAGFTFMVYEKESIPYTLFRVNEVNYRFIKDEETGSYQYITVFGKPDEIVEAEAVLFATRGDLFTHRGYIWARTLPLLKERILLGSGPDTFVISFPQNDYIKKSNEGYGFLAEVLTKPHSWYLQMAVHSGVIAMVLCVVFFVILIKDNLCGLIGGLPEIFKQDKSRSLSDSQIQIVWMGGIFASVLGYLICGITNDSCVAVAPLFWVLTGILRKLGHNEWREKP